VGAYAAHGPEAESASTELAPTSHDHNDHGHSDPEKVAKNSQPEVNHAHSHMDGSKQALPLSDENAMAQLIGVAILEFGVVLHRHVLCFCGSAYYSAYR